MKTYRLSSLILTIIIISILYFTLILSPNCSKNSSPEYVYIYITNETTTTSISNHAPSAKIIVPANNSCFNTSSFIISGTASDDILVKSIALTIDNSTITVQPSTSWSTTSGVLSSGTHTISLVTYDNYDASSELQLTSILIDDSAPLISISYPVNGSETSSQVNVSGLAVDASSSINSIQLSLDAGSWTGINPTKNWNTSIQVASGIHTIQAIAYDSCGNSGTSLITSFTNTSGYAVGWIGGGTSSWQTTNGASSGNGYRYFNQPASFSLYASSFIEAAADRSNNRITNCTSSFYDGWFGNASNGWKTTSGAISGSDYQSFSSPSGVLALNNNTIVADTNNNRISSWNNNGNAYGWFGGGSNGWKTISGAISGSDYQSFNTPSRITKFMSDFYIVDTLNHRISKWTSDGVAVGWIGGGLTTGVWYTVDGALSGSDYLSFNLPTDICADYNGNLYVADKGNNRICKWNYLGLAVGWIGGGSDGWNVGNGAASGNDYRSFNSPTGLDFADNMIYIADTLNNRICKWTIDGTAIGWIGGGSDGWNTSTVALTGTNDYRSFNAPEDVFMEYYYSYIYMYISDTQNHRISKWKR